MKTILAIDTATDRTTVGLVQGGLLVAEYFHDDPLAHGEVISKLVAQALAVSNEIDVVAIGMGPGAFTGLRVGIAFGQAFALAREIPWVGVSSLAAMALAHQDLEFIVAIDARRREFFCEHYLQGKLFVPAQTLQREELALLTLPLYLNPPTALGIATLAESEFSITEPIYIRRPDAFPAPKGVKFRPWTHMDLVSIYSLEREVYLDDPWSIEQFREEFAAKARQYLVAEHEGVVVGYAGVMHVGDVSDILTLTVALKFRRRGIAREFLRRMVDWSRNQGVIAMMLEMRVGNVEAEPLYVENGFRKISERANYYGLGINAVVMRKELSK